MAKHVNGTPACPACEEKLLCAHPTIASWFRDCVKPKHNDCHISWSYRGKADQEQAFLDGKSKLHFPMSSHNKSDDQGNPCSLALDLFELSWNGMACWVWKYFRDIANEAEQTPYKIKWGGLWATIGDSDHYQVDLI